MKQLPRILPRNPSSDKTSSPPALAPKDLGVGGPSGPSGPTAAAGGGGVKVIAMATLPQQQGAPVPVVILPQGCLSYEREVAPPLPPPPPPPPQQHHASAPPISVVQKARGNAIKHPLEAAAPGGGVAGASGAPPAKRKRGRPRKPRPEDSLPAQPPPPAPPPQPSIISSVTGGVIQKASSSSQPVLELLIQDQSGLVLGQLPSVSEHRGVVVQCQAGGAAEPDHQPRPLLLLQNPNWDLAAPGRTPMVEVIQKAPPPPALLPTLQEEQAEVEITLTPVELPPAAPSSSRVEEEEGAENSTS